MWEGCTEIAFFCACTEVGHEEPSQHYFNIADLQCQFEYAAVEFVVVFSLWFHLCHRALSAATTQPRCEGAP